MLVLILSQHSAVSAHVGKEIERASSKRRRIVSVRTDATVLPRALEYFLSESQWIDLESGDTAAANAKLIRAIQRYRAPQPPTASRVTSPSSALPPRHGRLRQAAIGLVAAALLASAIAYFIAEKGRHSRAPIAAIPQIASSPVTQNSIAVLPFADMSEKKDQEYLADGMAEEIINLLAQVPGLHVPARTSSFYFKGKSTKVPDIARELGVADVLEGSIRRSGNQIRVTAQLVRADNGFNIWSQTYNRDLNDVFKVQDDIANSVVQALQISLLGGPLTRQKGGTENLEAYQHYLRAVSAELQNNRPSLEAGRRELEQATKLDPEFGLAWAWMALNSMEMADAAFVLPSEGYPRAQREARHALEISPDLVMPHCVLQWVYRTYEWNWAASDKEGREALRLNPSDSRALMMTGLLSSTLGRGADAEREIRASLASDPLNTYARFNLGFVQYSAGHFAVAEASYRGLLEFAPDFQWTHLYLGKTLIVEGKSADALETARLEPDEESRFDLLPIALQANGRNAEADAALAALIGKFAGTSAYFIAMNYAYRNDHELAMQWLDRAYTQKDSALVEIVGEPLFSNLAADPRYKAFRRKMNLAD